MQVLSIRPSNRAPIPEDMLRLDYLSSFDGRGDWALARPAGNRELWVVVVHGHGSHGECDSTMPAAQSRRFADRMVSSASFRYDEIRGGGHDAPLSNTEALDWVMERIWSACLGEALSR